MNTVAGPIRMKIVSHAAAWIIPPVLVIALMSAIGNGLIPTGVPGEWTWNAPASRMTMLQWIPAILTMLGLLAFAWIGENPSGRPFVHRLAVAGLFPVAALAQIGWHQAAPSGYGLAKWPIATCNSGSSGYYSLARDDIDDLGRFIREYPAWIREQDVLHTGTHPPGLFVEARLVLDFWNARPDFARVFMARVPWELRESVRMAKPGGISPVEQASVVTLALSRWIAAAVTVWPVYFLMRRLGRSAKYSFRAALLWCVVPSAVLFLPASDLLFPFLAASAVTLAVWPSEPVGWRHQWIEPFLCGLVLALGMFFSLVFLAVGFIVAVVVLTGSGPRGWIGKIIRIGLIGAGFLAGTAIWAVAGKTDPLAIWLANQAKHAGFYAAYPRSYVPWLFADFVETAVGIGLPVFAAIMTNFGIAAWRKSGWPELRIALTTAAVLVLLAVSGRSLSEVGRLWLPFFPMLLTAAVGIDDSNEKSGSPWTFRWLLVWCGVEIVWLQTLVQCVYPV